MVFSLLATRVGLYGAARTLNVVSHQRTLTLATTNALKWSSRAFGNTAITFDPAARTKAARGETEGATKTKTKAKAGTGTKKVSSKTKTATKAKKTAIKAKPKVKKVVKKKVEKKEKLKINEDDLPPKRAPSPYILFYQEKARGATWPGGQENTVFLMSFTKQVAEQWKELGANEKSAYMERSNQLKEEYAEKFKQYAESVDRLKLKQINKLRTAKGKKKIHVPSQDPRPVSAFIRYFYLYRQEHPGRAPKELVVEASRIWRDMTDEQKSPFFEESRVQLDAWKARNTTSSSEASVDA